MCFAVNVSKFDAKPINAQTMKHDFKYPLLLTVAFLMSLSVVSCSDKDDDDDILIWDYYPIEMMVRVCDANGNDFIRKYYQDFTLISEGKTPVGVYDIVIR